MRVLILGGTRFVGRHIAQAMVAGGHRVSVFNRGRTPDELPASVERLRGDRDGGAAGLGALRGRTWDVCVDVSGYTPRQVRASAELLREGARRYVFVSAVSVYGDPGRGPVSETQPRVPPAAEDVTEITSTAVYGALKVACEDVVRSIYGVRCTLLRPQVIVGPYEPGSRFTYWVWRATRATAARGASTGGASTRGAATRGGEMLAPGDGSDHLQVIDARDVARFTRTVAENDVAGAFNLAGPRLTWAEFMNVLAAGDVVWVPRHVVESAGMTESELPLYRPTGGPRSSLMHVSNAAALAAGLTLTDFDVTVRDVRHWLGRRATGTGNETTPALSPEREAELIAIARRG